MKSSSLLTLGCPSVAAMLCRETPIYKKEEDQQNRTPKLLRISIRFPATFNELGTIQLPLARDTEELMTMKVLNSSQYFMS